MPTALAEERRAEIESDLWELQHDPDPPRWPPAAQVLARLLIGVPDDVWWRVERSSHEQLLLPRHLVVLTGAIFLLLAWWILPVTPDRELRGGAGTRVADCAATATAPKSTAEFRVRVIECTGAFFTRSARHTATGRE